MMFYHDKDKIPPVDEKYGWGNLISSDAYIRLSIFAMVLVSIMCMFIKESAYERTMKTNADKVIIVLDPKLKDINNGKVKHCALTSNK